MQQSDEAVINEYLNGNEDSFTEIVNRYLKIIYNFSYRLVGSVKEAEDITQEVFLKAWKSLKKFDQKKNFKTWIFSIARNTCVDYLRKRKDIPMSFFDTDLGYNTIEDNLIDPELMPHEIFALSEYKISVEKIMCELTVIQRQIIVLKYMNNMSLSEVSEIIKIPINTVKSHHRRAVLKLKSSNNAPKLQN